MPTSQCAPSELNVRGSEPADTDSALDRQTGWTVRELRRPPVHLDALVAEFDSCPKPLWQIARGIEVGGAQVFTERSAPTPWKPQFPSDRVEYSCRRQEGAVSVDIVDLM